MTGSNKILTVSYGTFSCTLEGFDDPFGTMRGIAEYFRDLAADDRYFGAEPPTPDVEMLQNIAQKEVQRRVEARVGDTGVSLRQVAGERAPEAQSAPPPAAPQAPKTEEAQVLDSGPLTFEDDFLMADEPEDVLTVGNDAVAPANERPAESVAEKLRRIRAVVSRTIEPEDNGPSFDQAPAAAGETGAEPAPAKRDRALTETINAITADLSDEDDVDADEPKALEPQSQDSAPDDADDRALVASIMGVDDASVENQVEEDAEPDEAEVELMDEEDEAPVSAFSDIGSEDEADFDDEYTESPLSLEAFQLEEAEETTDDLDSDASGTEDDTTIDDEDEDDGFESALAAAVAEPEADIAEDENETDDLDPLIAPEEPKSRRVTSQLQPISETNGDVGRLLYETDQKLADDEGVRRRRVISQMRAAVAATKADRIFSRIISRETLEAQDQSAYRADLSRAITRQPSFAETAEAEKAARPAPLVLVSSQRVDESPAEKYAPTEDAAPGSFKEFAAQMGATELPDLLEAAAAYSAFVEGQPHFSRPDIMKRVARVDPALEVSREAGLRSFGQLLRQGKIQKLQRGQFTIAETTRFNPAERIAGE